MWIQRVQTLPRVLTAESANCSHSSTALRQTSDVSRTNRASELCANQLQGEGEAALSRPRSATQRGPQALLLGFLLLSHLLYFLALIFNLLLLLLQLGLGLVRLYLLVL
jgi:hypothetical protein